MNACIFKVSLHPPRLLWLMCEWWEIYLGSSSPSISFPVFRESRKDATSSSSRERTGWNDGIARLRKLWCMLFLAKSAKFDPPGIAYPLVLLSDICFDSSSIMARQSRSPGIEWLISSPIIRGSLEKIPLRGNSLWLLVIEQPKIALTNNAVRGFLLNSYPKTNVS